MDGEEQVLIEKPGELAEKRRELGAAVKEKLAGPSRAQQARFAGPKDASWPRAFSP